MNLSQLITQLIATVKNDALRVALPALSAFFSNIAANPTVINIDAQLVVLEAALIAAGPAIGQDVLKQIAAIVAAGAAAIPPAPKP